MSQDELDMQGDICVDIESMRDRNEVENLSNMGTFSRRITFKALTKCAMHGSQFDSLSLASPVNVFQTL